MARKNAALAAISSTRYAGAPSRREPSSIGCPFFLFSVQTLRLTELSRADMESAPTGEKQNFVGEAVFHCRGAFHMLPRVKCIFLNKQSTCHPERSRSFGEASRAKTKSRTARRDLLRLTRIPLYAKNIFFYIEGFGIVFVDPKPSDCDGLLSDEPVRPKVRLRSG